MTADLVTTILAAVGVVLGVWRIHAHYETRNDAAHAELSRKIDSLATKVADVAENVSYLRGRSDERDAQAATAGRS